MGNSPTVAFDPKGQESNSGALALFLTYAGFRNSTHLPANMLDDVVNGSVVQGFLNSLLASAKSKWQCGDKGKFRQSEFGYSEYFSPENDASLSWQRKLDWGATGNWHLLLEGDCTWRCRTCVGSDSGDGCSCQCDTSCTVKGYLSKYYTLVWVPGGNAANAATTILFWPANWLGETYLIEENFETIGLDIGKRRCTQ